MEQTQVVEKDTIMVLTLRLNLSGLSLDNDEAVLARGDLLSSATDGADDTGVQVSPLPILPLTLPVSSPLANSGAVHPQSPSSVPAAASNNSRTLNGKAPTIAQTDAIPGLLAVLAECAIQLEASPKKPPGKKKNVPLPMPCIPEPRAHSKLG
jgi:hypothetical protein